LLLPGGSIGPDMFCNFYIVKNHKIAKKNSATTKAREKISTDFEFYKFFDVCLTKFENNQVLLYKISHRFQLTTKLLVGKRALSLPSIGSTLEGYSINVLQISYVYCCILL
jgi:hypothetical protein